jgi:large repetitive protein
VSGAASLTELAGGTLVLTAANTYAGGTTINGGTLSADNTSGLATGPGLVTVNNFGTLAGNGTVGNVLVASGATLAPGAPALTVGSVAFDSRATFTVNLNDPDHLNASGTVNLGGATLNVVPGSASGNASFTLIGTNSVSGTFAGLPEGATFTLLGTANFTITYQGGAGNDVVLTQTGAPTPPPTSAIGFNFLATVHGQYVSGGSVSQVSGGNLANGATEQFTTTSFDTNTGDYQGTLVTTTPDGSTFTSQIVGNSAANGTFSEVETLESGTNAFDGATGLTFAQGTNTADGSGFVAQAMGTVFFAAPAPEVYNAADWGTQITGTASANGTASVQEVEVSIEDTTTGLFWDGTAFESTTEDFLPASGTTSWSFDFAPDNLTNGHSYTIHSRATDNQGNVQTAPASATFTYDTTAPNAPASLQVVSATNGLTNFSEPTLTGTAEANSSVQVYLNGNYIGQAVADGSGAWTFAVPAPLADGNYSFTATATDAAGNVSAGSAPLPLSIATAAPTSEVAFHPQLTVHSQSTGATTFVSQLSGNGVFNGGTEVYTQNTFALNSDFTGGSFTATLVDTAPDGDTETLEATGTVTFATGALTEQLTPLSGTGQFDGVTGQGVTVGTSFADGTFLGAFTGTEFCNAPGSYNAANFGDRISGLAFSGGGAPVQSVAVSIQDTTTGLYWDGTAFESNDPVFLAASGTTSWSFAFSHNNLTDGHSYQVSSVATDAAGNVQANPGTATFTYDTTAPDAPANLGVTTPTTNPVPIITGTAEANSSVQVFANGTYIGQAVADGSGNWSVTAVKALVDGDYHITATATDGAGNVSQTSDQLPITIAAPQALTITAVGPTTTTATSVSWTVTFNTQVQGLTADNFAFTGTLTNTPNLNVASVTTSDGGTTWTVTTTTVLGSSGTLGLELSSGSGVTDTSNNPLNPANLPLLGDTFTWP